MILSFRHMATRRRPLIRCKHKLHTNLRIHSTIKLICKSLVQSNTRPSLMGKRSLNSWTQATKSITIKAIIISRMRSSTATVCKNSYREMTIPTVGESQQIKRMTILKNSLCPLSNPTKLQTHTATETARAMWSPIKLTSSEEESWKRKMMALATSGRQAALTTSPKVFSPQCSQQIVE